MDFSTNAPKSYSSRAIAAFAQQTSPSPKPSTKPRTDGFIPVVGLASILEKHGKV